MAKTPKPDTAASDAATTNTPEGRSGTAREAPSAGSGPSALQADGGVQPAAPPPSEPPAAADGFRHPAFSVRASQPVRRRAGRTFGQAPVTIEADTLTEAELELLVSDPVLSLGGAPGDDD